VIAEVRRPRPIRPHDQFTHLARGNLPIELVDDTQVVTRATFARRPGRQVAFVVDDGAPTSVIANIELISVPNRSANFAS